MRIDNSESPGASNQDSSAKDRFTVTAPAITLPKGGGAIRGIGEKFTANPVTGTGSMSVPIAVSPGRSGFGPQLALNYDSGSGNGAFGVGWQLPLPSIARKTDKGLPRYLDEQDSDVFFCPVPRTWYPPSASSRIPMTGGPARVAVYRLP
jgi:hypothetical protein